MPSYSVPVMIELNGFITVEAEDEGEAVEAARKEYYRRLDDHFKNGGKSVAENAVIDGIDVDVDFADPEDVELDEEEEEEEEDD